MGILLLASHRSGERAQPSFVAASHGQTIHHAACDGCSPSNHKGCRSAASEMKDIRALASLLLINHSRSFLTRCRRLYLESRPDFYCRAKAEYGSDAIPYCSSASIPDCYSQAISDCFSHNMPRASYTIRNRSSCALPDRDSPVIRDCGVHAIQPESHAMPAVFSVRYNPLNWRVVQQSK
jgi:hypothetical protein